MIINKSECVKDEHTLSIKSLSTSFLLKCQEFCCKTKSLISSFPMNIKFVFSFILLFSSTLLVADNSSDPQITTNATSSPSSNFDTIPQRHPELSTFVMLVNKAQVKDLFNGTGPFTVFAPTDEAFKKLGQKTRCTDGTQKSG